METWVHERFWGMWLVHRTVLFIRAYRCSVVWLQWIRFMYVCTVCTVCMYT